MRKTALFIAAGLFLVPLAAAAQHMGGKDGQMGQHGQMGQMGKMGGPMGHMMKLDKDGDHALSKEEFTAKGKHFEEIDADKDGNVTNAELTAHFSQKVDKMKAKFLERHDTDSNGTVTAKEVEDKRTGHFDEIDGNNDGKVTAGEMLDWHMAKMSKDGKNKHHQ